MFSSPEEGGGEGAPSSSLLPPPPHVALDVKGAGEGQEEEEEEEKVEEEAAKLLPEQESLPQVLLTRFGRSWSSENPWRSQTGSEKECEELLQSLFLRSAANRATIQFLMRGMPMPATFGFPGTTGGLVGNVVGFVDNFHPLISCFRAHLFHPFTREERKVIFLCTVAFNFLFTQFTIRSLREYFPAERRKEIEGHFVGYYGTKYLCTILYAVLIRQLVICPCLYAAIFKTLDDGDGSANDLRRAAVKLRKYKIVGDKALLWLTVGHLGAICFILLWYYALSPSNVHVALWRKVVVSELLNFSLWFLKFAPLFAVLYPIDRARWFAGGSLADYLTGRRNCVQYTSSRNYLDPLFPRCVQPEMAKFLPKNLVKSIVKHGNLSTFRSQRCIVSPAERRAALSKGESAKKRAH